MPGALLIVDEGVLDCRYDPLDKEVGTDHSGVSRSSSNMSLQAVMSSVSATRTSDGAADQASASNQRTLTASWRRSSGSMCS